jgi:hypothetical protein
MFLPLFKACTIPIYMIKMTENPDLVYAKMAYQHVQNAILSCFVVKCVLIHGLCFK